MNIKEKIGLHMKLIIETILSYCEIFYDLKYRIKTCVIDLSINGKTLNFGYGTTRYKDLKMLFDNSKIHLDRNSHFVDVGCGKGRVICMALINGFKNLYGVEINDNLYNKAVKNIDSIQTRYKIDSNVSLYHINATMFQITEYMDTFFFFNSFHIKIFIKVYNKIKNSLIDCPRNIHIILYKSYQPWVDYLRREGLFCMEIYNYKLFTNYEVNNL